MNGKQIGLSVVLVDFVALTAYAVYHHGYLAFFQLHTMNAVQIQIFTDLVIALSLFLVWMVRDARTRGVSPLPYVAMILTLGSIGALVYLIRRAGDESAGASDVPRTRLAAGAERSS